MTRGCTSPAAASCPTAQTPQDDQLSAAAASPPAAPACAFSLRQASAWQARSGHRAAESRPARKGLLSSCAATFLLAGRPMPITGGGRPSVYCASKAVRSTVAAGMTHPTVATVVRDHIPPVMLTLHPGWPCLALFSRELPRDASGLTHGRAGNQRETNDRSTGLHDLCKGCVHWPRDFELPWDLWDHSPRHRVFHRDPERHRLTQGCTPRAHP